MFVVSLVHIRTMLNEDPRLSAANWLEANIPQGTVVAVTPSHLGDEFYVVPLNKQRYQPLELMMTQDTDTSQYIGGTYRVLAANERAWHKPRRGPKTNDVFWSWVMNSGEWELSAEFTNRPSWPGILLRGELPEDMYYIYQEIRVYTRGKKGSFQIPQ